MSIQKYHSLAAAKSGLVDRGYDQIFSFDSNSLTNKSKKQTFQPKEVAINEYHRFVSKEGEAIIVFALTTKYGNQGLLEISYGKKANLNLLIFLDKVPVRIVKRQDRDTSKSKKLA